MIQRFLKNKFFSTISLLFFLILSNNLFANGQIFEAKLMQQIKSDYSSAAKDYKKLFASSDFSKNIKNWEKTLSSFKTIAQDYPNLPEAPKALYNVGMLYQALYQRDKKKLYLQESNTAYFGLALKYPNHTLADDALKNLGYNQLNFLQDKTAAKQTFLRLISIYPNSEFLNAVKNQLAVMEKSQLVENPAVNKASFNSFRYIEKKDEYYRLIFTLDGDINFKQQQNLQTKSGELLLDIDVQQAKISSNFVNPDFKDSKLPIKLFKILPNNGSNVKISLLLASDYNAKIYKFENNQAYSLVVDLYKNINANLPTIAAAVNNYPQPETADISAERKEDILRQTLVHKEKIEKDFSLAKVLGLKVKTIVIDAGHGGKDPGAVAFGVEEKDLTLKLALLLKKWLTKTMPGINIILTRSDDVFMNLEDRSLIANNSRADLFISLHVNASRNKNLFGVETYFLNFSNDSRILELAAIENATSISSMSNLNDTIAKVLQSSKMQESRQLAFMIQKGMFGEPTVDANSSNLGVKNAPFAVLVNSTMPSVLLEVGFMSNKKELNWLLQVKYLDSIARGITNGVLQYIDTASNLQNYAKN